MSPRTGRPTNNPRPNKLSIRISDEDKKILENYCERENVIERKQLVAELRSWIKNRNTRYPTKITECFAN